MKRRNISSASPYEPIVGFSRAVRIGNMVSVSGTAPIAPDGGNVGVGDPGAQARRCLEIIRVTLEKAGAKLEDVIRTRTFLTRRSDWEAVGRVHGQFFGSVRPAATMVVVAALLNLAWRIEMEFDAVIPGPGEGPTKDQDPLLDPHFFDDYKPEP